MAITRAQQVKQLLANGGRIGFKGGADASTVGFDKSYDKRVGTKDRPTTVNISPSGDVRTSKTMGPPSQSSPERDTGLEKIRQRNKTKLEKFKAKKPPVNLPPFSVFNLLKEPLQTFSDFNTAGNRKFFENVIRAGKIPGLNFATVADMTDEELEQEFQDYMSSRLAGEIDAMGNPLIRGDADPTRGSEGDEIIPLPDKDESEDQETKPEIPNLFLAKGGIASFEDGGMLVKPSTDGKRPGYRSAAVQEARKASYKTTAKSPPSMGFGNPPDTKPKRPDTKPKGPDEKTKFYPDYDIGRKIGRDLPPEKLAELFNLMYGLGGGGSEEDESGGGVLSIDTPLGTGVTSGLNISDIQSDPTGMIGAVFEPKIASDIKKVKAGSLGQAEPTFLEELNRDIGLEAMKAEGGPVGGIMDLETGRQQYVFGKLVKKLTKPFKKATRAFKKVAQSPIGKIALLYAATGGLGNLAAGRNLFANFASPSKFLAREGLSNIFSKGGLENIMSGLKLGGFENVGGNRIFQKNLLGKFLTSPTGIITAASALPFVFGTDQDDDKLVDRGPRLPVQDIINNPYDFINPVLLAEGGMPNKEPVAKKTMPLLDMGGKEKDYRETGGFVDMGRMEKADDVPARLSKNEFVFTADAVRNAGEGNIDKGAEVMYNMMKNLEAGGEVSKESQGLEGARRMFQTSQRLEEVI